MAEKHPKRPRDLNQWAKRMVDIATGAANDREPTPEEQGKNAAAVARGNAVEPKGGRARAMKLKTSFCPGGSGEYVYLQVFYAMPLLGAVWLPTITTTFQGQTVALASAAAAFKNEPYTAPYTPPAGC